MNSKNALSAPALGIASLSALLPMSASADAVIVNPLAGGSHWNSLGEPDTTTYGQTFKVADATNTRLDSFSFWLKSIRGTSHLRAYVAEWSGSGIVGTNLFAGNEFSGVYSDFTEIAINTGGLNLDASKQYVAYFSAAGLFDGRLMVSTSVPTISRMHTPMAASSMTTGVACRLVRTGMAATATAPMSPSAWLSISRAAPRCPSQPASP